MNRRTFLKTASVAGLAAAPTSAVLGYSPQHDAEEDAALKDPSRPGIP